jgi:hypothetical protein
MRQAVSLPHRLTLVAHEGVDHPLIDARCGEVAGEAMPVHVEAQLEPVLLAVEAPPRPAEGLYEPADRLAPGEGAEAILVADDELPGVLRDFSYSLPA